MAQRPRSYRFGVASAVALALLLAGCTKGGQFDPTEMFNNDVFDTKKKLKGERTPVFPEGVPGATSGSPSNFLAMERMWGRASRQGPHQVAQKSSSTTLPFRSSSETR